MFKPEYNMYLRGHHGLPPALTASSPLGLHSYVGGGSNGALPIPTYNDPYNRPFYLGLQGLTPSNAGVTTQGFPHYMNPHTFSGDGGSLPATGGIFGENQDSSIEVRLHNEELWNQFNQFSTEMIIAKGGRRMFPAMKVTVKGLDPNLKYTVLMDMQPADSNRYKYNGKEWLVASRAEPHITGRYFTHPDSPAVGAHWMQHTISFQKLKLTNNTLDQQGLIILSSMHKYIPTVHIIAVHDKPTFQWGRSKTVCFPQATFMAVTAYQNASITQLKIDNNPFAKGFRETGHSQPKKKTERLSSSSEVTSTNNDLHLSCPPPYSHEKGDNDYVTMSDHSYRSSSMSPDHPAETDEEIDVGHPPTPPNLVLPPPFLASEQEKVAVTSAPEDEYKAEVRQAESRKSKSVKPSSKKNGPLDIFHRLFPSQRGLLNHDSQDATTPSLQATLSSSLSSSGMMSASPMAYPYLYYDHVLNVAVMRESYGYRYFVPPPPTNHPSSLATPSLHHPYSFTLPLPMESHNY